MTPKALPSVPSMMSISVGDAVALGDAAAARAVQADGMDFVEIGQRAVFPGQGRRAARCRRCRRPSNRRSRRRPASARPAGASASSSSRCARSLWRKILRGAAAMADAGDHRGVVELIGEDDQARQDLLQRRQRRLVGDVAGGEQQRGLLAVQVGQLGLEFDVIVGGAGDVARAARARAGLVDGPVHGLDDDRVLALAEIVVGAPDDHVARLALRRSPGRHGECARGGASGRRTPGSAPPRAPCRRLRRNAAL